MNEKVEINAPGAWRCAQSPEGRKQGVLSTAKEIRRQGGKYGFL